MKKYDAILFDMGYTLVYFEPSAAEITRRAYAEVGLQIDVERLQAVWNEFWDEFYRQAATATFEASEEYDRKARLERERRIMAALGVYDEARLHAYLEKLDALYREPGAVRLYPEVKGVLDALQRKSYHLGIVSNWSWDLPDFCRQVGIREYFAVILPSARAGCSKPNPRIFHQALEKLKVPPQRAVYIGDSYEFDVVGARAAGLEAILIDRSADPAERDCAVIHNLEELLPLLE